MSLDTNSANEIRAKRLELKLTLIIIDDFVWEPGPGQVLLRIWASCVIHLPDYIFKTCHCNSTPYSFTSPRKRQTGMDIPRLATRTCSTEHCGV